MTLYPRRATAAAQGGGGAQRERAGGRRRRQPGKAHCGPRAVLPDSHLTGSCGYFAAPLVHSRSLMIVIYRSVTTAEGVAPS